MTPMHWSLRINPNLRRQTASAAARVSAPQLTPEELEQRQLRAIQGVWAEATTDIAYYESLVTTGVAPRVITSWADVHAIPPLTRNILQERPHDFRRPPAQQL